MRGNIGKRERRRIYSFDGTQSNELFITFHCVFKEKFWKQLLWTNKDTYEKTVYRLPKKLDEEVARLHLEQIGVLTKDQADYIGVPVEDPYKADHYRY